MAEKIHSTVLLSLCQKSVHLFPKREQVRTDEKNKRKKNPHCPPLSNIKGREALATWNVFNEALPMVKKGGGGASKCIKHPIELKQKEFLNLFGHSYCL